MEIKVATTVNKAVVLHEVMLVKYIEVIFNNANARKCLGAV